MISSHIHLNMLFCKLWAAVSVTMITSAIHHSVNPSKSLLIASLFPAVNAFHKLLLFGKREKWIYVLNLPFLLKVIFLGLQGVYTSFTAFCNASLYSLYWIWKFHYTWFLTRFINKKWLFPFQIFTVTSSITWNIFKYNNWTFAYSLIYHKLHHSGVGIWSVSAPSSLKEGALSISSDAVVFLQWNLQTHACLHSSATSLKWETQNAGKFCAKITYWVVTISDPTHLYQALTRVWQFNSWL